MSKQDSFWVYAYNTFDYNSLSVPSERIHNPWLIPQFVVNVTAGIQNGLKNNLAYLHTIPIMTKWKHVVRNVCKCIEN
jgi:hypothetical protein